MDEFVQKRSCSKVLQKLAGFFEFTKEVLIPDVAAIFSRVETVDVNLSVAVKVSYDGVDVVCLSPVDSFEKSRIILVSSEILSIGGINVQAVFTETRIFRVLLINNDK